MERLWGEIVPVPEDRCACCGGGERIGDWGVAVHAGSRVAPRRPTSTSRPGPPSCGDVAGCSIGGGPVLAPTPPPDIDLEHWRASIALIRELAPERLLVTHFGLAEDPAARFDELLENMARYAELAREVGDAEFARAVAEEIERRCPPGEAAAFRQAMPPDTLWAGLDRYWRKRAEAAAP